MKIHPYFDSYEKEFSELTSIHVFVLGIKAQTRGGSWGVGNDIWSIIGVKAKSADYVASLLEIPELSGNLLFQYVLDCLQPALEDNGETPLKHRIDELKGKGIIPIEPKQHLWYDAWDYTLKTGKIND